MKDYQLKIKKIEGDLEQEVTFNYENPETLRFIYEFMSSSAMRHSSSTIFEPLKSLPESAVLTTDSTKAPPVTEKVQTPDGPDIAPKTSDKSATKVKPLVMIEGFAYLKCEHCNKEKGMYLRKPIDHYKCPECGKKSPLDDVVPMIMSCACGTNIAYKTNHGAGNFNMKCLDCKRELTLYFNHDKGKYLTASSEFPKGQTPTTKVLKKQPAPEVVPDEKTDSVPETLSSVPVSTPETSSVKKKSKKK